LVVGHGGHSTAMRALSFSVPQVIMPANPLIDQRLVGAVLQRQGAAVLLTKHASVRRIRAAVEKVLANDSYRTAAERLGEQIRRCDGAEVAADAICDQARAPWRPAPAANRAAPSSDSAATRDMLPNSKSIASASEQPH
jgi:UDP:flavonoid glycosyltransferase YjiC (YdhE family)